MPIYEIEAGGKTFEVEAPNLTKAESAARLHVAKQRMTESAEQGAEARSRAKTPEQRFRESLSRAGTFGTAPTQEDIKAGREANIPALTLTAMTAPALVANPVAAAKATGLGVVGTALGAEGGGFIGGGLERAGAPPGTRQFLSKAGGIVGGLGTAIKGPSVISAFAKLAPHSRLGMLARLLTGEETAAVAAGAAPAAVGEAEVLAGQLAKQLGVTMDVAREMVRRGLAAEAVAATGTAGRAANVVRFPAATSATSTTVVPAARSIPAPAPASAPVAVAAPVAPAPAAVAAPVARAAPTGAQIATRHNQVMQFAKQAAQRSPKLGEKIWMELDEAGNPVRVLTPDQAGAAARAGKATTWVKNLWN